MRRDDEMKDVVFFEAFDEEQKKIKEKLPESLNVVFTEKTIGEYQVDSPPAKIVSIRTQSIVPTHWAQHIDACLTRSQGYDHVIRMFSAINHNVQLGYLGEYCKNSVAEHAIMCMFALLRKLKLQINQFDNFYRDNITGYECVNRKVLVVGVGAIGSQIANIAAALKMDVRGVDIDQKFEYINYVDLNEGIKWAEVIISAVPLTEQTHGLINYALMKQNHHKPIIINISRGEITPMEDLIRLLDDDRLAGLSLDVYEHESQLGDLLRANNTSDINANRYRELAARTNVIFTPHNAFNTHESVDRKARATVEAIRYFIQNKTFPNSISST